MTVPGSASGLVARTTPSTRSGSGVENVSSVGRFGTCSMPSTVWNEAAIQRDEGSRPTRRSVPGPSKCSASKRRPSSRSAAPTSAASRSRHAASGSSSSSRQTWRSCSHSRSIASSGPVSGCSNSAQPAVGQGTIVQFVVRSLTTWPDSATNGSWSRPTRAGSRSLSRPGATGPDSPIRAQRCSPSARMRSPYQGGTNSSVSSWACSSRARLTWMSKEATSTNFAPRR